jgi:hypothetical protein
MFQDNLPTFPDNKLILGQYLGPATDVGSALTAKILKSNGQTVCRSTLRHLTEKETHCPIHLGTRRVFDETVASHLGPDATDQDFPAEDLTPDFDHYDNDHDLDPDHGDLEVTPEVGDNHLDAEISVPRGELCRRAVSLPGNRIKMVTPSDWLMPTPSSTCVSTRLHLTMVMRL